MDLRDGRAPGAASCDRERRFYSPPSSARTTAVSPLGRSPAAICVGRNGPVKEWLKMERTMTKAGKVKDASPHWVFTFGAGRADGAAAQRDLLGGKGAYLAEMSRLGLPVPPGLTISSEVCTAYYRSGKKLPEALMPMVSEALDVVGKVAGARFGDVDNPLLVSVRSGSRASMPGMMDTVLNLGLNDETVEGLARRSSDRRFAYDTYRRFIQMYGDVVLGIDHYLFEEALENYKSLK